MCESENRDRYDPIQADVRRGCLSGIIATALMVLAALCLAGFLLVAHWNADKEWFRDPNPGTTTPYERTVDDL